MAGDPTVPNEPDDPTPDFWQEYIEHALDEAFDSVPSTEREYGAAGRRMAELLKNHPFAGTPELNLVCPNCRTRESVPLGWSSSQPCSADCGSTMVPDPGGGILPFRRPELERSDTADLLQELYARFAFLERANELAARPKAAWYRVKVSSTEAVAQVTMKLTGSQMIVIQELAGLVKSHLGGAPGPGIEIEVVVPQK